MENHNENGCGEKCDSSDCRGYSAMRGALCSWCHGAKHRILKVLLVILAFIIVFWLGFKLGEFTGFVKSELFGYPMIGGWSQSRMMRWTDKDGTLIPGMMQLWYGTSTPAGR